MTQSRFWILQAVDTRHKTEHDESVFVRVSIAAPNLRQINHNGVVWC